MRRTGAGLLDLGQRMDGGEGVAHIVRVFRDRPLHPTGMLVIGERDVPGASGAFVEPPEEVAEEGQCVADGCLDDHLVHETGLVGQARRPRGIGDHLTEVSRFEGAEWHPHREERVVPVCAE
jgi:hypothetical protein